MSTLKYIEPSSNYWCEREITDPFLALVEHHHGVNFYSEFENGPAFFIATRKALTPLRFLEDETYGGAIVYRQKIPPILELSDTDTNQEKVIKLTSMFQPKGDEYWTARICLSLDYGMAGEGVLETQNTSHEFYKDLYQAFLKFGKAQGIDYLAFTIRVAETYRMTTFEKWPFQLGITVANANDGLVHGLLSLKGKAFKPRLFKDDTVKAHQPLTPGEIA